METKESVVFMKKRKVVDRTDALAALEDLEKKMNQLKKRKTEFCSSSVFPGASEDIYFVSFVFRLTRENGSRNCVLRERKPGKREPTTFRFPGFPPSVKT